MIDGRTAALFGAIGAFGLAAPAALATPASVALDIEATSAAGSGSYQLMLDQATYDPGSGLYSWSGQDIDLTGPGEGVAGDVIATISSLSVVLGVNDPQVLLSFSLTAGPQDTIIQIDSGLVSFDSIASGSGVASAAMTITDGNGDGAWLTGMGPGGGAFVARRNGIDPDGAVFLEAIKSLTAGPGGSADANESFPGGGVFGAIDSPTSSLSSRFTFQMSGGDLVSGSSQFSVQAIPLPAPFALGLAGLGGMAVLRRRRPQATVSPA